jgi:hypothetical protein
MRALAVVARSNHYFHGIGGRKIGSEVWDRRIKLTHAVRLRVFESSRTYLSLRTAIWVAQKLTDAKFEVEEELSGHTIIRCQGIGYVAPSSPL